MHLSEANIADSLSFTNVCKYELQKSNIYRDIFFRFSLRMLKIGSEKKEQPQNENIT